MIFEVIRSVKGEWYFRIKSGNGKVVCFSDTYNNKRDCYQLVEKISKNSQWTVKEVIKNK